MKHNALQSFFRQLFQFLSDLGGGLGLYLGLSAITLCEFVVVIVSAVVAATYNRNKLQQPQQQETGNQPTVCVANDGYEEDEAEEALGPSEAPATARDQRTATTVACCWEGSTRADSADAVQLRIAWPPITDSDELAPNHTTTVVNEQSKCVPRSVTQSSFVL
jgi:hypothetical protein